jgi:hypothetical protein
VVGYFCAPDAKNDTQFAELSTFLYNNPCDQYNQSAWIKQLGNFGAKTAFGTVEYDCTRYCGGTDSAPGDNSCLGSCPYYDTYCEGLCPGADNCVDC